MKVLICYLLSSHTTTQNQGVWFSPHHGNSSNVHTLTLIQRTQAEASRKQQPMAWPSAPKHHELRSLHSLWRGCVWEMSNRNPPCLFRTMRTTTHAASVYFLSALWMTLNGVHMRYMTPRDRAQCSDGNERSTPQPSSSFFSTVRNSVRRSSVPADG